MDMLETIVEMIEELSGKRPPKPKNARSKRTDKHYFARIDEHGLVELTYIIPLEWEDDNHR